MMLMRLANLAFLIILLLAACRDKERQVLKGELMKVRVIDYPSGSTLNFYRGKLYLMGDDARHLLILDTALNAIDSVDLFESLSSRIPKPVKPDIESSEIIEKQVWLLGSGTITPYRDSVFQVDILDKKIKRSSLKAVFDKISSKIEKLNIEGFAKIKDQIILGNRRNSPGIHNYFIAVSESFLEDDPLGEVRVIPFVAPTPDAGISGLSFFAKRDLLFITCSEEFSKSAIADGEIGQSYLGIISQASNKLDVDSISTLNWVPFSVISRVFNNTKIESVAISEIRRGLYHLYFTADNDDGKTILFKVRMLIK